MRKTIFGLLAAAMLAGTTAGPVEAKRPTPIPLMPVDGDVAVLALLANQDRLAEAQGEELLKLIGQSLFLSADRETAEGGVTLYFLRVEDGAVRVMQTTRVYEDDLAQMRARFPDDADLPGDTFLFGDSMVPVDIYLGEGRGADRIGSLEPWGKREELLFGSALRLSEGRPGFVVAAFPLADEDSLAGGGFFMPQG